MTYGKNFEQITHYVIFRDDCGRRRRDEQDDLKRGVQGSCVASALPSQSELKVGPSRDFQRRGVRERTFKGESNVQRSSQTTISPQFSQQVESTSYKEAIVKPEREE